MTTEQDVKRRIEAAEFELARAKDSLKDLSRGYKNATTGRILSILNYWHPRLDEEGKIAIYITLQGLEEDNRFRAASSFVRIAREEGWCIGCCDAVGKDMQIRLFPINGN